MFPKRSAKMIDRTENLKFAKRTACYKEFRCKSQTVGTALNVKRLNNMANTKGGMDRQT